MFAGVGPGAVAYTTLPGGRGLFCPVRSEGIVRLQPFVGVAMLVLLFGVGIWVSLQYIPMHLH
jgi:hypothetical protein